MMDRKKLRKAITEAVGLAQLAADEADEKMQPLAQSALVVLASAAEALDMNNEWDAHGLLCFATGRFASAQDILNIQEKFWWVPETLSEAEEDLRPDYISAK